MKRLILLIVLSIPLLPVYGQSKWSLSSLQAGLSYNFMKTYPQDYGGPLGAYSSYDITNLKPLPGFVISFAPELKMSEAISLRTGLAFSYHVNSATMNYTATVLPVLLIESTNIKTRFRNLYAQVPLEIAFYPGRKKTFGIYGGVKGSLLISNAGTWETSTITNNYDFSHWPPILLNSDTTDKKAKPPFHSGDVALEIGFTERLSDYFVLEERVYKGLLNIGDYSSLANASALKQSTIEIVLGWRFKRKVVAKI